MQRFGQSLINEAAITWVDLAGVYQGEHITYRYEGFFPVRDKVEAFAQPAIIIRFMDGSNLTFPITHPEYDKVLAWLTGEAAPLTAEQEMLAGLPEALRDVYLKGR